MILELRIQLVEWLLLQGGSLHDEFVNKAFLPIQSMVFPGADEEDKRDLRELAEERVSRQFVSSCMAETKRFETKRINPAKPDGRDALEAATMNRLAPCTSFDNFPWIVTGYYLLTVDYSIKSELLGRFCQTKANTQVENFIERFKGDRKPGIRPWNEALVATLNGIPRAKWAKDCSLKQSTKDHEVFNQIFESMLDGCKLFEERMQDLELLTGPNYFMTELLGVCFAVLQRLMVKKPVERGVAYDDRLSYTSFAWHLKINAKDAVEMQQLIDNLDQPDEPLIGACQEVMRKMRSNTWSMPREWTEDGGILDSMDELLQNMEVLTRGTDLDRTAIARSKDSSALVLLGPDEKTNLHFELDGNEGPIWEYQRDGDWHAMKAGMSQILNKAHADETEKETQIYVKVLRTESTAITELQADLEKDKPGSKVFHFDLTEMEQTNLKTKTKRKIRCTDTTRARAKSLTATSTTLPGGEPQTIWSDDEMEQPSHPAPPEMLKDLLGKLRGEQKDKIKQLQETGLDSVEYGAAAVRTARSEGCSVLVCLRDQSEMTADPVGFEKHLLQAPDFASGSASGFVSRIPCMNVLSAGTANSPWTGIGEGASHHRLLHAFRGLGFMGQHRR